mgnify:CR=1 FL=1
MNNIAINPPEVAKIFKTETGRPISPLNLIDPLIRKEFDKKNKKKNGKYIGRI